MAVKFAKSLTSMSGTGRMQQLPVVRHSMKDFQIWSRLLFTDKEPDWRQRAACGNYGTDVRPGEF